MSRPVSEIMEALSAGVPAGEGPRVIFDGVSLTLGATHVLDDLRFTVEPGTVHAIIGPNGGGKTSLLRSLLGQMPFSGSLVMEWPGGRTVGYMPQLLDLDRTLPVTVDDFMAMVCQDRPAFLGLARRYRERVDLALEAVGMLEKRDRQFGQLSGGETKRVLLAQAFIPMPGLLVMDEPMAGVDETFAGVFVEILRGLRDRGVTVFWVHHDLGQVRNLADTVTCINRRVLFSGRPQDLIDEGGLSDVLARIA